VRARNARRLGLAAAAAASAAAAAIPPAATAGTHSLLGSRRLWATIDVCNPSDQPDTVGVRGSMPGDGHAGDRMYMSFRLQMLESATGRWRSLTGADSPQWIAVGSGASARQGGSSFVIRPVTGEPPIVLRGVVVFQWRRGQTVVAHSLRTTSAGHESFAGADPSGFSAARCSIG
jgi:hypothetical protein